MFISIGGILLIGVLCWLIWSKLCDIEQKQFKMHDEIKSSLSYLEEQLHLTQSMIQQMEENIPPVPEDVKGIWRERELNGEYK